MAWEFGNRKDGGFPSPHKRATMEWCQIPALVVQRTVSRWATMMSTVVRLNEREKTLGRWTEDGGRKTVDSGVNCTTAHLVRAARLGKLPAFYHLGRQNPCSCPYRTVRTPPIRTWPAVSHCHHHACGLCSSRTLGRPTCRNYSSLFAIIGEGCIIPTSNLL